jgi:hypothetical protein
MMRQEDALRYVSENKHGDIQTLKNTLGDCMVEQFELVGFITRGVVDKGFDTWQVSGDASAIYKSIFQRPTFIDSIKGLYCHYILRF